ncbi:hypothetical protein ElyMa_004597700 [Elysia marginata]|uniref:Uncharacterized protein n=1 Tax=Elysia marginata TaxID=1093978 RepID=A0AAV4HVS8_9GAST|nr:hypothetical protein ElyMa_004597700 [Elysia marginata]
MATTALVVLFCFIRTHRTGLTTPRSLRFPWGSSEACNITHYREGLELGSNRSTSAAPDVSSWVVIGTVTRDADDNVCGNGEEDNDDNNDNGDDDDLNDDNGDDEEEDNDNLCNNDDNDAGDDDDYDDDDGDSDDDDDNDNDGDNDDDEDDDDGILC